MGLDLSINFATIGIYTTVSFGFYLLATYITTWLESSPAKPDTGREPPMAPYYLPYIGHMLEFLSNPGKTVQKYSKYYPNIPFSLLFPGAKFHVITSPETAFYIFTKPRDFLCEPVVHSMMDNGLECDGIDLQKFEVPIFPRRKGADLTPEHAEALTFTSHNHGLYLKYLTGSALDPILQVYKKYLLKDMKAALPIEQSGSITVNMHTVLRRLIFDASSVTFFGTRIMDISPDLWDHWKSFDDAAYIGVRSGLSFYLRPWFLKGRRLMLEAFDKWVQTDFEDWDDLKGVWSDKWGVKLNWEREKMSRDHEMTVRGRACVHVSFLWVIITNTAPMLTWTMNSLLQHPEVLSEFRRIVDTFMAEGGIDGFNVGQFAAHPFIAALWKELLRLGVTSASARVVSHDSDIQGYVVKRGSVMLVPTKVLHFDPEVFSEPDKFNPWRWLEPEAEDGSKVGIAAAEQLKRQHNSLRPFGGGTGVCSGRFIAEQEVLMAAAVLTHLYEWELDPKQISPWPNLNPRGLGAMHPIVDPIVKVSRRDRKMA